MCILFTLITVEKYMKQNEYTVEIWYNDRFYDISLDPIIANSPCHALELYIDQKGYMPECQARVICDNGSAIKFELD